MEISIENLAHHGTRTLHIPILILSGCICLVTAALLLRFLYLNKAPPVDKSAVVVEPIHSTPLTTPANHSTKSSLIIKLASSTIFSRPKKPATHGLVIVECPRCKKQMTLWSTREYLEFPCPYCGVEGFMDLS